MTTQLKARPTEYNRIRFRSKSEAVFARCLDLSPVVGGWFYEPSPVSLNSEHPWDFSIIVESLERCRECQQMASRIRHILVELKPSEPTDTYVEPIRDAEAEYDRMRAESRLATRESYVIYGSPWETHEDGQLCYSARPILIHKSHRSDVRLILGITPDMVESAKNYRYDLKGIQD